VTEAAAAGGDDFAEAVSAANTADVVILALGEPGGWTGENSSRSTLGLPGRQMELFDAVVATGKPVIVVLINGRPLAVPRVQEKAAAILEAWDPACRAATAWPTCCSATLIRRGGSPRPFPRSVRSGADSLQSFQHRPA